MGWRFLLVPALLASQAVGGVTVLSHTRENNHVHLRLNEGAAEMEWLSPSAYRFRRCFTGVLRQFDGPAREPVALEVAETPEELVFSTRYLRVRMRKNGLLIKVAKADGSPVMEDLSEAQSQEGVLAWDRAAPWGVEFYGLGPRSDSGLNARGQRLQASVPFLISTAGYGECHFALGRYIFDLRSPDRYRIEVHGASEIDHSFYFGPTPKEILEEHLGGGIALPGPLPDPPPLSGTWATLRESVLRMVHAGFSAVLHAGFDELPYRNAPATLRERASQLASAVNAGVRRDLAPFFFAYEQETHDRGLPIVRPLALQFPGDPQAARYMDEFMVGDELLAAPFVTPGEERDVYLPQGIWTRLDTNEVFRGRQSIRVKSGALPLFARNGTIVPLETAVMELHYFPKLGAEFFLYENDRGEYSQVHAAPAADIMRLEIESLRERDYEWIVHHADRPRSVGFEDRQYVELQKPNLLSQGKWFQDPRTGDLHVRAHVRAGEDCIINLTF